jgi:hypothetical protein
MLTVPGIWMAAPNEGRIVVVTVRVIIVTVGTTDVCVGDVCNAPTVARFVGHT